jgi:hypothetical protein
VHDTHHEICDQFLDFTGEIFEELGSVLGIHDPPERRPLLKLDEVVYMPKKRAVVTSITRQSHMCRSHLFKTKIRWPMASDSGPSRWANFRAKIKRLTSATISRTASTFSQDCCSQRISRL